MRPGSGQSSKEFRYTLRQELGREALMNDRQMSMVFELFAGLLGAQEVVVQLLIRRATLQPEELLDALQSLLEKTRAELPGSVAVLPLGHLIRAVEQALPPQSSPPKGHQGGAAHPPWLRDIIEGGAAHPEPPSDEDI